MWVRGLKLLRWLLPDPLPLSHPMWVRGLKHYEDISIYKAAEVAPHVGAWIETLDDTRTGKAL